MKKLLNPYAQYEGYNCFGCDPQNSFGLQMSFFEEGDEIVCRWQPGEQYQGYSRVLHGGIQATLIDELASWVVFVKCRTSGMTGSIQVVYHKSVSVDEGEIEVRGRLESQDKKKARIRCRLYQAGELKSEGHCEYLIFSEQLARRKLHYPGVEAFYPGLPIPFTIESFKSGEEELISWLVASVFDEFVGYDYSDEGRRVFYNFIQPKEIADRQTEGNLLLTAKVEGKITGMIEMRNWSHICLLFVDKKYQRKGMAKSLFLRALEICRENKGSLDIIDVNASPYSENIYKRLGFKTSGSLKEQDGIKFIPMKYIVD